MTSSRSELYKEQGFVGPIRVLSKNECVKVCKAPYSNGRLTPVWNKAHAVSSPVLYRIATRPEILETVRQLIGDDILLWGTSIIYRGPGQVHHWHNDIESSTEKGKALSVWVGLKNTNARSGLTLLSRSHAFHRSVQEARYAHQRGRSEAGNEEVLAWARSYDPHCEIVTPEVYDGEALFFDGWLWHSSVNLNKKPRLALLLQYASPDTEIRIPDPNNFEWPFRTLDRPKPPCLMVSGKDRYGVNQIVPAPIEGDGAQKLQLSSRIYSINMPLFPDEEKGWRPYPIFKGATQNLQRISCHVSALAPGKTPHPPHHHVEEEILVMLGGEADLTLPDLAKENQPTTIRLLPGQFVYYPAWFYHTLTARGDKPANYLMFKWNNDAIETTPALKYGNFNTADYFNNTPSEKSYRVTKLFEDSTDSLKTFQSHVTVVEPGGGYDVHTDSHDVAILVLEGEVETLGTKVGPNSVIYYPGGEPHGMYNPGSEPARYLVFEFHGKYSKPARKQPKKSLLQKALSPKAWKDKIAQVRGVIGV